MKPTLYLIIPCYNEQEVLPITAPRFLEQIKEMQKEGLVSPESRIMFVDDGSKDNTWQIIKDLAKAEKTFSGIRQSRNRGHQSAVLAGLMEAKDKCDITITVDCDGQDDITAASDMVKEYLGGSEVVYGVRSDRRTDNALKRGTAQGFYRVMSAMGAEVIYNHADYRLISSRVLTHLADFKETNLFLRGLVPLVGFKSSCVYYKREKRLAGKSHYSLRKMLSLAFDGITSLSVRPLKFISSMGIFISLIAFIGVIWAVISSFMGVTVAGWASTVCIVCFMGGIQLICLGVIGEYVGKIYTEVKARPRYIISEKTDNEE